MTLPWSVVNSNSTLSPVTLPVTSCSPKDPSYLPVTLSPSCSSVKVGSPVWPPTSTSAFQMPVMSTLAGGLSSPFWAASRDTRGTARQQTTNPNRFMTTLLLVGECDLPTHSAVPSGPGAD